MLERTPDAEQMTALVGVPLYEVWNRLCVLIDEKYDMERLWNNGGKAWTYEYKYPPGRQNSVRIICKRKLHRIYDYPGKEERIKFEKGQRKLFKGSSNHL